METPTPTPSLDLATAPKKTYNSPRLEPQGKANEIVRSGSSTTDFESCNMYNISGTC